MWGTCVTLLCANDLPTVPPCEPPPTRVDSMAHDREAEAQLGVVVHVELV